MKSWRFCSAKALVAAAVLAAASPGAAAPLKRVETRIELQGVGPIAAHLRHALPDHLAAELAQNPLDVPPGSRLVVRVTEIFLSNDLGNDPDGGGMMMDALDGEALLLDAKGKVLLRKSVAARMPPGTNLMSVSQEPKRVEALAESLAYWVVREMR